MPRRRKNLIVGALIMIVLMALCWFFVLSPRLAEASLITTQTAEVNAQNLASQARLTALQRTAANLPQSAARVQRLLTQMPPAAELPLFLNQVEQAAMDAGIPSDRISTITPSVPVPLSDQQGGAGGPIGDVQSSAKGGGLQVASLDFSLSVLATYDEIVAFLNNLESLDRAVLVTQVTVAPGAVTDEPGLQSATIVGTAFVLQSELPDLVTEVENLARKTAQP